MNSKASSLRHSLWSRFSPKPEFAFLKRDYLRNVEALCRRYGTLFVLDEVQTGMYRTGTFLAAHQFEVEPDIVVLAKALSGGLVPVGAVLMSDEVFDSVYSSLPRAFVHTSTFGENSLAMRAGLATLEVLEREELGRRAIEVGRYLREQLTGALRGFDGERRSRSRAADGNRISGTEAASTANSVRDVRRYTRRNVWADFGDETVSGFRIPDPSLRE